MMLNFPKALICFVSIMILGTVLVNAQYKEGYLINNKGDKYTGYFIEKKNSFVYKETMDSKKEKVLPEEVKCIVIGTDSFISIVSYKIPMGESPAITTFAKALLRGKAGSICEVTELEMKNGGIFGGSSNQTISTPSGNINVHGRAGHSTGPYYRAKKQYIIVNEKGVTNLTDFNFYHEMPTVVGDCIELKNEIISKKLVFKDIDDIIKRYEAWRIEQAKS